jgi:hypothetical protein
MVASHWPSSSLLLCFPASLLYERALPLSVLCGVLTDRMCNTMGLRVKTVGWCIRTEGLYTTVAAGQSPSHHGVDRLRCKLAVGGMLALL